ncbi:MULTISPECIES: FMN-binding protein [unclassified Sedimentibacter]|uniref:FMN-binding protein n=1 Tax=unclassified Sedimentibacter TaxID=2649220 RepID=UPI0027E0B837|nr:FMN-binding protein [Sedimentibacter sp. MB35-C1]WMJ78746.1 FMN-binding protein [Sedimentibacter sp. MB35-C1]
MKAFKILGFTILLIVIVGMAGVFYLSRGLEEVLNVSINSVDLSEAEDGVYKGSFDFGRWCNELNVTVENRKITKIEIEEDVKFANEEVSRLLFQRVIEKQNTTVDTVSGGTVTSKAYLKSIEDALNK